jgi:4-hydroxy-2-oxoheptanedioate aldolase
MDRLREALSAGPSAFASWVGIGDTLSAEMIGRAGYDCVILDTQHGGVTWDNLCRLMQAMDLSGTPSLVRVGGIDQVQIMRALDLGAVGVIVPTVSTEAEARAAADSTRYPPQGVRSFGPVRNHYSVQPTATEPLCFVMIETAEALDNLDAIAAVPNVDGLFVGPVDLALSLGLGPVLQPHDEIFAAIDKIVQVCRRHKKISGSASLGLPYARALLERGVQLIAQGSDLGFIRRGAAAEIETLRTWRKEAGSKVST